MQPVNSTGTDTSTPMFGTVSTRSKDSNNWKVLEGRPRCSRRTFGCLSRWPAKRPAAQQMQMQMQNRLPRAAAVVQHRAIAFLQIQLASQLRSNELYLPQYRLLFRARFAQRSEMLTRANQNMRRCLRADILKSKNFIILIHHLRRNPLRRYFAKQAIRAHSFPPAPSPWSRRTTIGINPSLFRSFSPNRCAASSPGTLPTRTR